MIRKKVKNTTMQFRLSPQDKEKLLFITEHEGITYSEFLRTMIRMYYDETNNRYGHE